MSDPHSTTDRALADDPAEGLRAVRALRALSDRLEYLQVHRARDLGWTWEQIAHALGVTRQAVHKRYGRDKARPAAAQSDKPRPGTTDDPTTDPTTRS